MTDSEYLFAVVAAVYLLECVAWARGPVCIFRSWLPHRFGWCRPSPLLGNLHGGVVLTHPLPPLGTFVASQSWPLSISPQGILSDSANATCAGQHSEQPPRFLAWDDVKSINASDKCVRVNGEVFVRVASDSSASHWAAHLEGLRRAQPTQRAGAISAQISRALDPDLARERWTELDREASDFVWLCNLLFFFIFVAAPALIWTVGLSRCWGGLLSALLFSVAFIAFRFTGAHRSLYPEEVGHRRLHALVMLLNPLVAIRAKDLLSRDLFAAFHPLVVAHLLCSPESFRALARVVMLDARFAVTPVFPDAATPARETADWFHNAALLALKAFLQSLTIDPEELVRPDAPVSPLSRSYCPRCQRQFEFEAGICDSCGGIEVRTWTAIDSPTSGRAPGVGQSHPAVHN